LSQSIQMIGFAPDSPGKSRVLVPGGKRPGSARASLTRSPALFAAVVWSASPST
jgi:hypothetical protein